MTQTPSTEAPVITAVPAVQAKVREITTLAFHGEHYMATRVERDLWEGVLEAIAGCNAQAGYLAAAALETKKIDFPRTALI